MTKRAQMISVFHPDEVYCQTKITFSSGWYDMNWRDKLDHLSQLITELEGERGDLIERLSKEDRRIANIRRKQQ